jgi:DNA invertase Pin-like site-specific DNA recombinase
MIAAIYARKSNEQEKAASGASESCDRQIEHARAYIVTKLWADLVGLPCARGANSSSMTTT